MDCVAPKQDQMDLLKANPQLAQNWDEEYRRSNQSISLYWKEYE